MRQDTSPNDSLKHTFTHDDSQTISYVLDFLIQRETEKLPEDKDGIFNFS